MGMFGPDSVDELKRRHKILMQRCLAIGWKLYLDEDVKADVDDFMKDLNATNNQVTKETYRLVDSPGELKGGEKKKLRQLNQDRITIANLMSEIAEGKIKAASSRK
jgi:hypothetical protein